MSGPAFTIYKFFKKVVVNPKDPSDIREVDYVEYGPVGMGDRTKNTEAVSRLASVQPGGDLTNTAIQNAHWRWEFIKPKYEAWKAGQEAPLDGTPLAVLNSIPQEQAEFLRTRSVRTIEELAGLTDTHIDRMKISGLRNWIAEAKRWLEAADSRKAMAAMAQKDREIAEQQEQINLLMSKMDELAGMVAQRNIDEAAEPKRAPGRPRKEAEATAA